MRNRINLHTIRDDGLLGILKHVSKTEEHQVYGALIPKEIINKDILNYIIYQTYFAYASGNKEPKKARKFKKPSSPKQKTVPVSPKEPTKKPAKKPKPTKKKAPVKADRGKGDGADFESGVPDEQQCKISGTDEGTGTKLGIPDVPKYDYESKKDSWGDSGEEEDDDDDEDDSEDERDDDKEHKEEEEYVDERLHTPENCKLTDEEDNANNEKEENKQEKDDVEELYKDVNVNLRKEDVEMTDADQGGADQHNVSQESGFKHVEEDAHLLNFENASPADNEIASLMETTVYHEEPSSHTSSLFTIPVTIIPEITSAFTITIPPPPHSFNPLPQQGISTPTPTASEATTSLPTLPDFSSIFRFNDRVTNLKKNFLDFATPVIEQNITESLEAVVLAKSSSQPKSTDAVVASLSEFELTKILMDKIEEHKSYLRDDYKRELYDVLVKSYNTDKDLFETYGEIFMLKRSRDDKDKDQDPSAGSDQGTKRRKSSKEADHTVDDSRVRENQECDTGNNDEQPDDKVAPEFDWYKKPKQPLTPDPDWNKRQHVDFRPPQTWISDIACAEKPPTSFDELMDTPIDFSASNINWINITNLT
nr:hypothetical protein [Tanacetum cinerariifolium]